MQDKHSRTTVFKIITTLGCAERLAEISKGIMPCDLLAMYVIRTIDTIRKYTPLEVASERTDNELAAIVNDIGPAADVLRNDLRDFINSEGRSGSLSTALKAVLSRLESHNVTEKLIHDQGLCTLLLAIESFGLKPEIDDAKALACFLSGYVDSVEKVKYLNSAWRRFNTKLNFGCDGTYVLPHAFSTAMSHTFSSSVFLGKTLYSLTRKTAKS